jgi:hypothetical protein
MSGRVMGVTPDNRLDTIAALRAYHRGDSAAFVAVVESVEDSLGLLMGALHLARLLAVQHFGEEHVETLLDRLAHEEYREAPNAP